MNLKRYGVIAAALLLAACASLIGPREVELRQDKLQTSLERKFPMHQRALGVFEVELSHPRLDILPESDRVALTIDLGVTPLLGASRGMAACWYPAACGWTLRATPSTSPMRMSIVSQSTISTRASRTRWPA
jgi:hypothetical protein